MEYIHSFISFVFSETYVEYFGWGVLIVIIYSAFNGLGLSDSTTAILISNRIRKHSSTHKVTPTGKVLLWIISTTITIIELIPLLIFMPIILFVAIPIGLMIGALSTIGWAWEKIVYIKD